MTDHDQAAALERAEWQLRRFFDDLFRHGAIRAPTASQAYFVEASQVGPGALPEIRFGIAFGEPDQFVEYRIAFEGKRAGRAQKSRSFEAAQLPVAELGLAVDIGLHAAEAQSRGDAERDAELPLDRRARRAVAGVGDRFRVSQELDGRNQLRVVVQ